MSLRIGIPVLNRGDLLLRLLRSLDHQAEALVIVNRIGPTDDSVRFALEELQAHPPETVDLRTVEIEGNLGVAGSWNKILDVFGGDCIIANSDIEFAPGVLARALQEIRAAPEIVMQHLKSAACFYASPDFTRVLGWFDENFYPAYCEDQEMAMRSRRMGVLRANLKSTRDGNLLHVGSQTVRSAASDVQRYIRTAKKLGCSYLLDRWGSIVPADQSRPEKRFPFDNPNLSPADWTLNLETREEAASLCHEITGHVCPLVYHRSQGGLSAARK